MVQYEEAMIFSSQEADYRSPDGSTFSVDLEDPILVPKGAQHVTIEQQQSSVWWSVINIKTGVNDTFRILISTTTDDPVTGEIISVDAVNTYDLVVPEGIYDSKSLGESLQRVAINRGITYNFEFVDDESSEKVVISLDPKMQIDFTVGQNMAEIMGFDSAVYPSQPSHIPNYSVIAPNDAKFNEIDYFLIHCDLLHNGIAFNGKSTQILNKVPIDAGPFEQVINRPFNPIKLPCNHLVGARRNSVRLWLTDQKNRLIDTNDENWSVTVVLRYEM